MTRRIVGAHNGKWRGDGRGLDRGSLKAFIPDLRRVEDRTNVESDACQQSSRASMRTEELAVMVFVLSSEQSTADCGLNFLGSETAIATPRSRSSEIIHTMDAVPAREPGSGRLGRRGFGGRHWESGSTILQHFAPGITWGAVQRIRPIVHATSGLSLKQFGLLHCLR